jgi:hypothetical protein
MGQSWATVWLHRVCSLQSGCCQYAHSTPPPPRRAAARRARAGGAAAGGLGRRAAGGGGEGPEYWGERNGPIVGGEGPECWGERNGPIVGGGSVVVGERLAARPRGAIGGRHKR